MFALTVVLGLPPVLELLGRVLLLRLPLGMVLVIAGCAPALVIGRRSWRMEAAPSAKRGAASEGESTEEARRRKRAAAIMKEDTDGTTEI